MNRVWLLVVLVLLSVFALWLLRSEAPPSYDDRSVASEVEAEHAPAPLTTPDDVSPSPKQGNGAIIKMGDMEDLFADVFPDADRSGDYIGGTVRTADGDVPVKVLIELRRAGARGEVERTTHARLDGRFRISAARNSEYVINAYAQHGGMKWVGFTRATSGVRVHLFLREFARVFLVRVVDTEGNVVPSARAALAQHESSQTERVVDGVASFARPTEDGLIHIWGAESSGGKALPLAATTHPFKVAGLDQELSVKLAPESAISGTVVDALGSPIAGARVSARGFWLPIKDGTSRSDIAESRTDNQGRFRLSGLAASAYDVDVSAAGYIPIRGRRATAPTDRLRVTLQNEVSVTLRVIDWQGRPVARANVSVHEELRPPAATHPTTWTRSQGSTNAKGEVVLGELNARTRYKLGVNAFSDRTDLRHYEEDDWVPADQVVRLERGYAIAGVVVDSDGIPLAGASILVEMGKRRHYMTSDEAGRFDWPGLPKGKAQLVVSVTDYELHQAGLPSRRKTLQIETGREDVRVVLDRGASIKIQIANWPMGQSGAHVHVFRETGGDGDKKWEREGMPADVAPDGIFEKQHVAPKTRYRILIGPVAGMYGVVEDLQASVEVRKVELIKGQTLRGQVRGVADLARLSVVVIAGDFLKVVKTAHDGSFTLPGLPPGNWSIAASTRVDGVWYSAEVDTRHGDAVVLDLKAAED